MIPHAGVAWPASVCQKPRLTGYRALEEVDNTFGWKFALEIDLKLVSYMVNFGLSRARNIELSKYRDPVD